MIGVGRFAYPQTSNSRAANRCLWLQNFALALDPLGRLALVARPAIGTLAVRKLDSIPSVMCRSCNSRERVRFYSSLFCHNPLSLRDLGYTFSSLGREFKQWILASESIGIRDSNTHTNRHNHPHVYITWANDRQPGTTARLDLSKKVLGMSPVHETTKPTGKDDTAGFRHRG